MTETDFELKPKQLGLASHIFREAKDNRGGEGGRGGQVPAGAPRKVVYTADVQLIVNDLTVTEEKIRKLVSDHKGYVTQSESSGAMGARRHGLWKVRIPVESFEAFLDEVAGLGVPEKTTLDSQDVSEEFYDVQARIKNKKVEEDRLLNHLEKSTGKLEDILAVEKELSRVRGEIEQMEGRLQYLSNQTEMTTVTINLQEIKDYIPPQAPGFGQSIADTFTGSAGLLQHFGKALVLAGAAVIPWLPIVAVLGLLVWLAFRRRRAAPTRATDQPA
jgi:hypothetical protein